MKSFFFTSARRALLGAAATTALAVAASPQTAIAETRGEIARVAPDKAVFHRTIGVDGLDVFYREAGDPSRPTVLLLHGFPTSSQMFRNLIPALAEKYHVLAPDYPGYGGTETPARSEFDYTFANLTDVVEGFLEAKDVGRYTAYVMDYGAPVGFRLFERHPERIDGFIIQNGNAYLEGLEEFWDPIRAYWTSGAEAERDALRGLLTLDATKWQYTHGLEDPSVVAPDAWITDQYLLDRPGNQEIQLDLFYDYRTNLDRYPAWQALFREHQPPALIVWGANDHIFPEAGAHPYTADLEDLEVHILDGGHFVLESHGRFVANEILDFLDREID